MNTRIYKDGIADNIKAMPAALKAVLGIPANEVEMSDEEYLRDELVVDTTSLGTEFTGLHSGIPYNNKNNNNNKECHPIPSPSGRAITYNNKECHFVASPQDPLIDSAGASPHPGSCNEGASADASPIPDASHLVSPVGGLIDPACEARDEGAQPSKPKRDRTPKKNAWGSLPKYEWAFPYEVQQLYVQVFQEPTMKLTIKVQVNWVDEHHKDQWQHTYSADLVNTEWMQFEKYEEIIREFYDISDETHAAYLTSFYEDHKALMDKTQWQRTAVLAHCDGTPGPTPKDRPVHMLGMMRLYGRPKLDDRDATFKAMTGDALIVLGDQQYNVVLDRKQHVGKSWKWYGYWFANQTNVTGSNGDGDNVPARFRD